MAPAARTAHLSLIVLIALSRLFHTQRKPVFTVSSNIKVELLFAKCNARELLIICASQVFLQVALHGTG
jgi:hypothetical protein